MKQTTLLQDSELRDLRDQLERARDCVDAMTSLEKHQLSLFPPDPRQKPTGQWLARSNGGVHDPAPMMGFGDTPQAAILAAIRGPARRSVEGAKVEEQEDQVQPYAPIPLDMDGVTLDQAVEAFAAETRRLLG